MTKLTVLAFLPRCHLWQGRRREHWPKYTSEDRLRRQFGIYTYMCRFLLLRPAMVASCAARLFDPFVRRLASRISSLMSSAVALLWSRDEPGTRFSNTFTPFSGAFACSSGISSGAPFSPFVRVSFGAFVWCLMSTACEEPPKSSANAPLRSGDDPGVSFPGEFVSPFVTFSPAATVTGNRSN